jgi:hypothetical protein
MFIFTRPGRAGKDSPFNASIDVHASLGKTQKMPDGTAGLKSGNLLYILGKSVE